MMQRGNRLLFGLLGVAWLAWAIVGCGGGGDGSSTMSSAGVGLDTTQLRGTGRVIAVMPTVGRLEPGQSAGIAVLVADQTGHPIDGASVQIQSRIGGELEPASGDTRQGWFYTRLKAGATVGTELLTALSGGALGSAAVVIDPAVVRPVSVQLFLGANQINPGRTTSVAVQVRRGNDPANEVPVLLTTTCSGEFAERSGQTANGWFQTVFTGGDHPDTGEIMVTAQGVATSVPIRVSNAGTATRSMRVTLSPPELLFEQTSTVIVEVMDDLGAPANARLVLSGSLNGSFNPESGDSQGGLFSSVFTAGTEPGSCTITVSAFGSSASAVMSIYQPRTRLRVVPAVTRVRADTHKNPLMVAVTDEIGRPLSGATVVVNGTLGITFDSDSGNTNESGFFSTFFSTGSATGTAQIMAAANGATASVQLAVW